MPSYTVGHLESDALRLVASRPATISLANTGRLQHIIVVLDTALRLMARPGQTVSTDFVLERAAVYQFQCAIQDHRDVGMVATLTVTQPNERANPPDVDPAVVLPAPPATPGGVG